jgi:hypothetical protein
VTEDVIYYPCFYARGRDILCDVLQAVDPFVLAPADIVERVLGAGHEAEADQGQAHPCPMCGAVSMVDHHGRRFAVAVDIVGDGISVQEIRAAPSA